MFDIESALKDLQATLDAMQACTEDVRLKTAVAGKQLDTIKAIKSCMETAYSVGQIQAFMEEVLNTLEQFEPTSRERVLSALREKRLVR